MAIDTGIEWCDHTASPWYGCEHDQLEDGSPHPGCLNCYAEAMSKRNPASLGIWGPDGMRVKSKSFVGFLEKVNRRAARNQRRETVFASMCDPFEDRPELVPWREEMFAAIDQCPWVTMILLTKRPENIRRMIPRRKNSEVWMESESDKKRRNNVWLLTSVSNQQTADEMIPELLKCRDLSPVLGVSAEPLLGPIDLLQLHYQNITEIDALNGTHGVRRPHEGEGPKLDWVIAGGESGPKARPCHPDWIRSLRDQCQAASVPFFFKQWGEFAPWEHGDPPLMWNAGRTNCIDSHTLPDLIEHEVVGGWYWPADQFAEFASDVIYHKVGKKAAGAMLDGRDWREFPGEALRD